MADAAQEDGAKDEQAESGLARFRIQFDRRLSGLASTGTVAYAANEGGDGESSYFAMVCEPHLTPRITVLPQLRKLELSALMGPLEWGAVDSPEDQRRKFAIIFEKPAGGRVLTSLTAAFEPITEEIVIRNYMTPLIDVLKDMARVGVAHTMINPTNIFYRDGSRNMVTLGECVTAPPGARQPVLFAPIETGLAAPLARGVGKSADDIYALGVTLILLLIGQNPVAHLSDGELIAAKIESGTYATLLTDKRLPIGVSELLRGMVMDDVNTRWTLGDITEWLPTRGPLMRHAIATGRPTRSYEFKGGQYTTERRLAFAFATDPAEAAASIRSRRFELWLQNAIGSDKSSLDLIETARNRDIEGEGGEHRDALLTARVCIALDPLAPIRYRGLSIAVDGFGTLLAAAHKSKDSPEILNEMVKLSLPLFWLMASSSSTDNVLLAKAFRSWQNADERRAGPERILYDMCLDVHCLSPIVESEYAIDVVSLLPALEKRAGSGFGGSLPIDKHITAFVMARSSIAGEWVALLQSQAPFERVIGALQLLARIQRGVPHLKVPKLGEWFGDQAKSSIARYHNRRTRTRLSEDIPKAAASGNLGELLAVVDNFQEESRDAAGYAQAVQRHNAIVNELTRIGTGSDERANQATVAGERVASVIASILAWLAGLASLMLLN